MNRIQMKTQKRHLIILLALFLGNAGLALAQERDIIYLDLAAGNITITASKYSGSYYQDGVLTSVSNQSYTPASTEFYIYQSQRTNSSLTASYYATTGKIGDTYYPASYAEMASPESDKSWGEYITDNNDVEAIVTNWPTYAAAVGKTATKNTITISGNATVIMTLDGIWSRFNGISDTDAPIKITTASNVGNTTLKLKGDSRVRNIYYLCQAQNKGHLYITSAEGDGEETGTLTIANINLPTSDSNPVSDSIGWNGMTMIGPDKHEDEYGLTFKGGTVFAGYVKQKHSQWTDQPGYQAGRMRFTACVGSGSSAIGEVTITGGRLTAVSNGTSSAIGSGGGMNGDAKKALVNISGGYVYAYAMGVYCVEHSEVLPTVAIGSGGTFNGNACGSTTADANTNPSEINITGGYVFAQSVGGPAIGGGSSLHNRAQTAPDPTVPSNGGKAIINISGGAIVEAYSVAGSVGGHAVEAGAGLGGGRGNTHAGDVEVTISGENTIVTATGISGGTAAQNVSSNLNAGNTTVTIDGGELDCNYIIGGYRNHDSKGSPGTVTLSVGAEGTLKTGYVYGGRNSNTSKVGKVDITINGTAQGQFVLSQNTSGGSNTFTMTGDAIIDNSELGAIGADTYPRRYEDGGAVYSNHASDVINISGGTITNCTAARGGAIYLGAGTLTMSGGTITGNTATTNGGGIYKLGSMSVSGTPKVKGNTANGQANNVYIPNTASEPYVFYGSNGLTCGAQIGVTKTEDDHTYSTGSETMEYTNITQMVTENTNRGVPIIINTSATVQRCEFIVPASGLIPIKGKTIKAMTFYLSATASSSWGSPKFLTYMVEVPYTTFSSYHTGGSQSDDLTTLTRVYDQDTPGDITNSTITFTFKNGGSGTSAYVDHYDYVGGNLLIGNLSRSSSGAITHPEATFSGIDATGASASGTGSDPSFNQQNFLPKVTFTLSDNTSWTYPDDCYTTIASSVTDKFFFDDTQLCKVCSSSCDASLLSPYTLYFVKNAEGDDSWLRQAPSAEATTDYTLNAAGTHVESIHTGLGLAYFASEVLSGMDYAGQTVTLTSDINLSGHNWEPAGFCASCGDAGTTTFAGTFDGQGHRIYNLNCNYDYKNVGLFGHVTGTVKNVVVNGTVTGSGATNVGGIAGEVGSGGEVCNSMASVSFTGGTTVGGLVGSIASGGSLKNSFANTSATNGLVGDNAGTVENCYVLGTTGLAGSGTVNNCYASGGTQTGTNGTFGAVNVSRTYGSYDCLVTATNDFVPSSGNKSLLKVLNNWVDSHPTYARWGRPTTTVINSGYPVLKMDGSEAVAGDGTNLYYGTANGMIAGHKGETEAVYLYKSTASVASNVGETFKAPLYIDEDAAITHYNSEAITAYVGVTLKNTQPSSGDSWDWHMFSPALTAAPLGVEYPNNTPVAYGTDPDYNFNTAGYFPTIAAANYGEIDYYCYFEPQYHWINLKRNGNSHYHEDGTHEQIHYKATPSAEEDVNETTLIPGKGYLLATKQETLLQCKGELNNTDVSIAVTTEGDYRTGYNLIGNPYQSYYDFNVFASDNGSLWGGTSKASYILLSGDSYTPYAYNASNNELEAPRWLHPHQGFMIVASNSGTATFYNSKRITEGYSEFRDERPNYALVNLIATDEDGKRDFTTVELGRPDRGGALKAYDLHLGKGCIYTHYEDEDYSIAFTQPGLAEVGIRFEADEEATFTMTWGTQNGDLDYLHLKDNITGTDIDCLTTEEYRFTATPDDYKSRFRLMFGYTDIEEPEVPEPVEGPTSFAFQMGSQLVVNGEGYLEMIDMLGRIVRTETLHGSQSMVSMPHGTTGVYVLRLTSKGVTRVQKIVVN